MNDFSIELSSQKIKDVRIRQYFGEVLSSYSNGNYRSAVVMLWSIVVCDVLFKLDQLQTTFGDPIAESILKEIEALRKKNPRSPDWEQVLIDKVKERTQLLEEGDYLNLISLRDHRHLSAHPVLSNTDILYSPSKEQVRAHLRNVLEGLLMKPPIMTKKVIDALLEDLEAKKNLLPDDESLSRYLSAKYFGQLTPTVERVIFKSLWRLVFKTIDPRCDSNRAINYRALRILYKRNPSGFNDFLSGDSSYFSELHFAGDQLNYTLHFLSENPSVFRLLSESARTPIENCLRSSLDLFATAWYSSDSIQEHIKSVLEKILNGATFYSDKTFQNMYEVAMQNQLELIMLEMSVHLYGNSVSYDMADRNFAQFVRPYLRSFSLDQLRRMVHLINGNSQTYSRRGAFADHSEIKLALNSRFPGEFDYSQVPNF